MYILTSKNKIEKSYPEIDWQTVYNGYTEENKATKPNTQQPEEDFDEIYPNFNSCSGYEDI